MDESLVGVDDLLEVESLVAVVGEGGLAVEVFVEGRDGILVGCGVESDDLSAEDAAREVSAVWDEVYCDAMGIISLVESVDDSRSSVGT